VRLLVATVDFLQISIFSDIIWTTISTLIMKKIIY